jgi:hypothetical protein
MMRGDAVMKADIAFEVIATGQMDRGSQFV